MASDSALALPGRLLRVDRHGAREPADRRDRRGHRNHCKARSPPGDPVRTAVRAPAGSHPGRGCAHAVAPGPRRAGRASCWRRSGAGGSRSMRSGCAGAARSRSSSSCAGFRFRVRSTWCRMCAACAARRWSSSRAKRCSATRCSTTRAKAANSKRCATTCRGSTAASSIGSTRRDIANCCARNFASSAIITIVLAFDTGYLMVEPVDGLPRLDHAINAGLLLAWISLQGGDLVGLFGFDEILRQYQQPRRGVANFSHLLRATARLDYHHTETNFTLGACRTQCAAQAPRPGDPVHGVHRHRHRRAAGRVHGSDRTAARGRVRDLARRGRARLRRRAAEPIR